MKKFNLKVCEVNRIWVNQLDYRFFVKLIVAIRIESFRNMFDATIGSKILYLMLFVNGYFLNYWAASFYAKFCSMGYEKIGVSEMNHFIVLNCGSDEAVIKIDCLWTDNVEEEALFYQSLLLCFRSPLVPQIRSKCTGCLILPVVVFDDLILIFHDRIPIGGIRLATSHFQPEPSQFIARFDFLLLRSWCINFLIVDNWGKSCGRKMPHLLTFGCITDSILFRMSSYCRKSMVWIILQFPLIIFPNPRFIVIIGPLFIDVLRSLSAMQYYPRIDGKFSKWNF